MNLHLYIPPTSAHPPGVQKSLIFGNLQRYWKQNTYITNFIDIAKQFAHRLIARGYEKETIKKIFKEAAEKLDNFAKGTKSTDDTLYLHWMWHPRWVIVYSIKTLYKSKVVSTTSLSATCGQKNYEIASCRPS